MKVIRYLGVAAVAIAAAISPAQAQTTTLRFNQSLPANHWVNTEIIKPWIADIEQASQGKVKVTLTGASLGGWGQSMDLASSGVVDITIGTYGVLEGRFPLARVTEVPFLGADSPLPISLAYWKVHQEHLSKAQEHEKAGVHLLGAWTSGANHIFTSDKEVAKPADLKGLKFFVPSPVVEKMLTAVGAVGVVAGSEQLYELVSRKVVDGAFLANTGPSSFKLEEFVGHQLQIPGSAFYSGFYIVMNQDKWKSLTEEQRQAIASVSGEALVRRAAEAFERQDVAAFAARQKAGRAKITTAQGELLEEFKRRWVFVEQDWIKSAREQNVDGQAALARLREIASSAPMR